MMQTAAVVSVKGCLLNYKRTSMKIGDNNNSIQAFLSAELSNIGSQQASQAGISNFLSLFICIIRSNMLHYQLSSVTCVYCRDPVECLMSHTVAVGGEQQQENFASSLRPSWLS